MSEQIIAHVLRSASIPPVESECNGTQGARTTSADTGPTARYRAFESAMLALGTGRFAREGAAEEHRLGSARDAAIKAFGGTKR